MCYVAGREALPHRLPLHVLTPKQQRRQQRELEQEQLGESRLHLQDALDAMAADTEQRERLLAARDGLRQKTVDEDHRQLAPVEVERRQAGGVVHLDAVDPVDDQHPAR